MLTKIEFEMMEVIVSCLPRIADALERIADSKENS